MQTTLDALDRSQVVTATILALRALKRANQIMTYRADRPCDPTLNDSVLTISGFIPD
jgi:hypothetical protein